MSAAIVITAIVASSVGLAIGFIAGAVYAVGHLTGGPR